MSGGRHCRRLLTGGERVSIDNARRTAQIRGLPYRSGLVYVNVIGITASKDRVESGEYSVRRSPQPNQSGHQHDHTLSYSLGGVPLSVNGVTTRLAIANAAQQWRDRPLVVVCRDPCAGNDDEKVVPVKLKRADGCHSGIACLKGAGGNIETHVGNRDLIIEWPPISKTVPLIAWTRNKDLHYEPHPDDSSVTLIYLDAIVLHEFGHALGMTHWPRSYKALMHPGTNSAVMTQTDRDGLHSIYESHTSMKGW